MLDSVNLTLAKGKIYGLIGRNGAGKTTLLSILSAQNPPSEGSVVLETEEGRLSVWENEKALSHICFSRELNVGKNTALSATKVKDYLRTASVYLPHWDQELADELIRKFHLDVKQKIGKLSKGMVSISPSWTSRFPAWMWWRESSFIGFFSKNLQKQAGLSWSLRISWKRRQISLRRSLS